MPLIQLDTSCEIAGAEKKEALAQQLSRIAAECIGKPERYVMALVQDRATMTMAGASGPAALVTVKSIGGLTRAVNQTLSEKIGPLLQQELDIAPDRVYLNFEELPGTHWGWNGSTFG